MQSTTRTQGWLVLLTALSLSIGWGIRGNFGHENGAMIPGALAAMGAVLLSGRADWWERVAFFGFFGAIGWSFGGSISYMQVISYTHSGHSPTVLYGFACLFVIGFLWAAFGGAGTALPAILDGRQLAAFIPPFTLVFGAWMAQDVVVERWIESNADFRHASPLYWYDTDWLGVTVAMAAALVYAAARRRWDAPVSLILHMGVGWWIGFLALVVGMGLRMTPPRGDNWAGCLGMVFGMWAHFRRHGWWQATGASLISGFVGGFGFAGAAMLKLVEVKSGLHTNWHSVLEQSYGLINGLGLAAAMLWLSRNTGRLAETERMPGWARVYASGFVLVAITYVNLVKNPKDWVKAGTVPAAPYGIPAGTWFDLAYAALAVLIIGLLWLHQRRPLAVVPSSSLGRGQMLYLVFLWWMVVGNFERALFAFALQRWITEGVVFLNAVLCTGILIAKSPSKEAVVVASPVMARPGGLARMAWIGCLFAMFTIGAEWAVVRLVWGDTFAGEGKLHIRFGPNATATTEKPAPGKPHP